ncbi:LigT-like protein [Martensiomyces pterosporus]|nr:LigT-like protein [Martensiomyces pterosporus]
MSPHKYSLWICPPPGSASHTRIGALITEFSESLGTSLFPPHATLFSPIRAASDEQAIGQVKAYVAKLHEEHKGLAGIPVGTLNIATGEKFYQCILLEVGNAGPGYSDAMFRSANETARRHWAAEDQRAFYPHVSLVYGEYEPERLASIASDVRSALPDDARSLSYVATEIRIVETVGPCEQWRDIGGVSISTGEMVA